MKKIEHGFKEYYYLDPDGNVYNAKSNSYLKQNRHKYKLRTLENKQKTISLKELYKAVYNKNFCRDKVVLLENEIFREIENTDGKYFISNYGRVKSLVGYEAIIMKAYITPKGYYRLQIIQDGEPVNWFIHSLVATSFLEPPKSINYQIHHKDFNSLNNRVDNLEYLSPQAHRKKHNERSNNAKINKNLC